MNRSRIVLGVGLAASLVAIIVTMVSADSVRSTLASAYEYPSASGVGLDEAASWTMTYLFTIATGCLALGALYLLVPPLAASRIGWWIGAVLAGIGLILVFYNSTQEFPMGVKIVFYLPILAAIAWLTLPEAGRLDAKTRTTTTAA